MGKRKPIEWVILEGEGLFCRRCGAREKLFPVSLTTKRMKAMKLIVSDFEDAHAKCALTENSPESRASLSPLHWLESGDTGQSSITIAVALGEIHIVQVPSWFKASWPSDPADFGRCHRLLERFPAMRPRLGEVAAKYPGTPWVAYVREWDRLTALYEEELPTGNAPKLYALMVQLRAEAKP